MITQFASSHLNFIRGLMALLVFIGHARAIYFIDYPKIQNPTLFDKIIYFISGFGHQAVIVFFVLSGFFIGQSIFRNLDNNSFSYKNYFLSRITRLFMVLIPALILGFLWDYIGYTFSTHAIYHGIASMGNVITFDIMSHLTIQNLFGNILFLHTIIYPPLGSNTPLWSLANEFWYYVLFPLMFIPFYTHKMKIQFLLFLLITLFLFYFNRELILYFSIWLLGALIAFIQYQKLYTVSNTLLFCFSCLLALGTFFGTRFMSMPPFIQDALLGITFSLFLYFLTTDTFQNKRINKFYNHSSQYLANISFTLYAVHLPFYIFLFSIFKYKSIERSIPSFPGYGNFFLLCLAVLVYSSIMWYLFERNTDKMKKKLIKDKKI